jgi:hypothetical protein
MNSVEIKQVIDQLKTWPVWKKALVIAAALIITHGAVGLGTYIAGTKSLKPYKPPEITLGKPDPKTTVDTSNPLAYTCGNEIGISAVFENEKKLKITGKDKCKQSVYYYDLNYQCKEYKYTLGLAPGLLMTYSLDQAKLTWMVGGQLYFKRNYGRFSVGPQVGYYQSIDSKNFAITANLALEYRF